MKKIIIALPLAAALAACGGDGSSQSGAAGGARQQIKAVGSSTVYPFTTAVAEQFQRDNPKVSVVVESTGTGAGMKLFCGGVGAQHPDIENASRRIKPSEVEDCRKNGVNQIIEVPIGIDGLAIVQAKGTQPLNLTQADVYKALAANPFGKGPNRAQTWRDVNSSLPPIPIRVLGPPPTSGTRDSLVELYMEKGCASDPAMDELKKTNEDEHKQVCTKIREDGAFVEAGENDNLIVQKVSQDPNTLGILGYSFLEENADRVQPVQVNGISPTGETIANLSYPGARKLYVYVKGEHMTAKPALRDFFAAYAKAWGNGGPLEQRGLVPLVGADAEASNRQAQELKALDPAELK